MSIDRLSSVNTLAAGDLLALFSQTAGTDVKVALSVLTSYLQSILGSSGAFVTQYASPNATGFGVLINPPQQGQNVFLLLTPTAGFAAGTITLPPQATLDDGQELLVTTTQSVTALTVAGNGATVNGAPTTLAANAFFNLRYDAVNKAWYRVG